MNLDMIITSSFLPHITATLVALLHVFILLPVHDTLQGYTAIVIPFLNKLNTRNVEKLSFNIKLSNNKNIQVYHSF